MTTRTNNRIIIEVPGFAKDAEQRAQDIANDTFREMMPVRVFNQGNRQMISGVLPIRILSRILTHQAAARGSTTNKASLSTNRPIITDHMKTIADYLVNALTQGDQYIIPPMTLNATKGLEVYIPDGMRAGFSSGFAVLPQEQELNITDGMHRFLAIQETLNRLRGTDAGDRLMADGIPVMITVESDGEQVHQDFADAGKTRPLPPSLMAVYDVRQPGNRATHQLINKVPLFRDRIDATSSTLSIQSPYLFLVNQIRQFVKSSLSGNPSLKDDTFKKMSITSLSNPKNFDSWVNSRVAFLEIASELIPEWKKVLSLPVPQGPEGTKALEEMKILRSSKPVSLSAAALNTLGLVSHEILRDIGLQPTKELKNLLAKRLEPLRKVKWDRHAALWNGNLVQVSEGKDGPNLTIKTQTPSIRQAAKNLMDLVGPDGQLT
ncbi:MAG: DGQHR domain-containing protein [SAR202 cluster bacterium]|nr:DGQHR domain-containing protein [SAR202 cluster bacterium]